MSRQTLQNEIEELSVLKDILRTYEEIAASRMQKIRSKVLQTRDFLQGLSKVYGEVKFNYQKETMGISHTNSSVSRFSSLQTNGKLLAVFISANTKLYGSVVNDTFVSFLDFVRRNKAEVAIVGKLGKLLFEEEEESSFSYFDMPDHKVDPVEFQKLTSLIVSYEHVYVFYEQFVNVAVQKPAYEEVSGGIEIRAGEIPSAHRYLFEPSVEKIMEFFETEIFASLFEQKIHESQLAKFASRMVNLDLSTENIDTQLGQVQREAQKESHLEANRKQQHQLSCMRIWR